jgi:hypothetical protein
MEPTKTKLRAAYRKLRLDITQDIIDTALPQNSSHCMIADAVKRALPDVKAISVDLTTIRFTDPVKRQRYIYLTPRSAQVALINFDQGNSVVPFSFQLRTATQVTRIAAGNSGPGGRKTERVIAASGGTGMPVKVGGTPPPRGPMREPRRSSPAQPSADEPNVTLKQTKGGALVRGYGLRQLRP